MATSAFDVLSGIAAAVAGLAGDKVGKDGKIPGLDLATIIPALLGSKSGGAGGLLGTLASVVSKTGLLKSANLGNLTELAGSLFSNSSPTESAAKKTSGGDGIAGLAAAIMGNSGKGLDLASIASMAAGLAKSAKSEKEVTGLAGDLGKTLNSSFGLSLNGGAGAITALGKVLGGDTKGALLQTVLKSLV